MILIIFKNNIFGTVFICDFRVIKQKEHEQFDDGLRWCGNEGDYFNGYEHMSENEGLSDCFCV